MNKSVEKQRPKAKKAKVEKPLTLFNQRVREARKHAGLGQQALATLVGCDQTTINALENRSAETSLYTVQIARACNVDPFWLAAKDPHAPKFRPTGLSPDVLTVGVAWAYIKPEGIRERLAKDVLELGLKNLPQDHPNYKHALHMLREIEKDNRRQNQLRGEEE